jgi:hypothetical protein
MALRHAGEPSRADNLRRGRAEQPDHEHETRRQQHQERKHPVAPEAARLFHTPRMIDRCADRAEHTERPPHEKDGAADPEPDWILAKSIELPEDEVELPREIA